MIGHRLPVFVLGSLLQIPVAFSQTASPSSPNIQGQYVFYLVGQEKASQGTELAAIAGSITVDGSGHITAGVLDKNSGSGILHTGSVNGSYRLDSTGKGVFTIGTPQGSFSFTLYAALPAAAPGSLQGDIAAGAGTLLNGSGEIAPATPYLQGTISGGSSPITSAYSFSQTGELGADTFLGSGLLNFTYLSTTSRQQGGTVTSSGLFFLNGAPTAYTGFSGSFTAPDPTTARFTMTLADPAGASSPAHYVAYSAGFLTSRLFFFSIDPHPASGLQIGSNVRFERSSVQN